MLKFSHAMDIAQLAARLDLTTRQVRYVLDHQLVPGVKPVGQGRGVPRRFTADETFGLACAALLRAAGLRRDVVRCWTEQVQAATNGLALPPARLVVADGHHELTLAVDQASERDLLDAAGRIPTLYPPLVRTRLDVAALRTRLHD